MTKKLLVRFIIVPFAAYIGYCATRGAVAGFTGKLDDMTPYERDAFFNKVASFRA